MNKICVLLLCLIAGFLLAAKPNTGTQGASNANTFKLVGNYLTEDSRDAIQEELERARGIDHLKRIVFSPGPEVSGTADGGSVSSLTDTGAFTADALVGRKIIITGASSQSNRTRPVTIVRNTADAVFFDRAYQSAIASGDTYVIYDGKLPPGDDTNGDGSKGQPYQTFDRMVTALSEPNVAVVLDCAEFLSSRDAGGTFQIDPQGVTSSECIAGPDRTCLAMTTPVECGRKPARITFDTPGDMPQGFISHLQSDVWLHVENILDTGPDDPEDGHDFIRQDAGTNKISILNVGSETRMGYNNQLLTAHGSSGQLAIAVNPYMRVGSPAPYGDECRGDNQGPQRASFADTDVNTSSDEITITSHGLSDFDGPFDWQDVASVGPPTITGIGVIRTNDQTSPSQFCVDSIDANTVKLSSNCDALSPSWDFTDAGGTGTHEITERWQTCTAANTAEGQQIQSINMISSDVLSINSLMVTDDKDFQAGLVSSQVCATCNYSWALWPEFQLPKDSSSTTGAGFILMDYSPLSGISDGEALLAGAIFTGFTPNAVVDGRMFRINNFANSTHTSAFAFQNTFVGADYMLDGPRQSGLTGDSYSWWAKCNLMDEADITYYETRLAGGKEVDVDIELNIFDDNDAGFKLENTTRASQALAVANEAADYTNFFSNGTDLAGGSTSGGLPNDGFCLTSDCRAACTVEFRRDFPVAEWGTVLGRDILGLDADVKGIWLNRTKDGDIGADPGRSGWSPLTGGLWD